MTSKVDALLTISTNQESAGKFNLVLTFSLHVYPSSCCKQYNQRSLSSSSSLSDIMKLRFNFLFEP